MSGPVLGHEGASAALVLRDIRITLDGRTVVDGVSWSFAAGRTHAVVGRSGAGKSVLFKACAGLVPLAGGSVHVHRPPLVFVHQDPALIDTLDVLENISFAVERTGLPRRDVAARVDSVVSRLQLTALRSRRPASLPLALQKRVALARALCLHPGVLVLDEPTTGLDPLAACAVDDAIVDAPHVTGATVIVITHSQRTLERLAGDVVMIHEGRARALQAEAA